MTPNEERNYLCELILASSQWRISEGDETDAIRLEVQDRLRQLNGMNTVDENGYCQSEPDNLPAEDEPLTGADYQALEAQKLNDYLEKRERNRKSKAKYNKKNVRVFMDGKPVWKPREDCHQELRFPNRPGCTSFRWVWDGPKDKKSQEDVNKLSDELWKAHENGNDL